MHYITRFFHIENNEMKLYLHFERENLSKSCYFETVICIGTKLPLNVCTAVIIVYTQ